MDEAALRAIASDLAHLDAPWALVGGWAVCARAEPRPTADVDIAVSVDDDGAAQACVHRISTHGYQLTELIVHDTTGRLATARLQAPHHAGTAGVDLFFASCGVEPEIVAAAEPVQVLSGTTLPVARTGHLLAIKFLWRPSEKSERDLHALLKAASADDVAEAAALLDLVTERGYNRGRDLRAALDARLPQSSMDTTHQRVAGEGAL